jgi:hypothetical protein
VCHSTVATKDDFKALSEQDKHLPTVSETADASATAFYHVLFQIIKDVGVGGIFKYKLR